MPGEEGRTLVNERKAINMQLDNIVPTDAGEDADGDGFTNLEEFLQGTDPLDATSVPKIVRAMPWLKLLLLDD